ncbi:MAG TPA: hypothetical protein VEG68_05225 [Terriglobales bacterium]|nr:hypothetical protein [Terriglobales bacterium]
MMATVTRAARNAIYWLFVLLWFMPYGNAQTVPYERKVSQPKAVVDKAVKELQPSAAGRLPVLDGFVIPGDRPLDRFQRGYYQCTVDVTSLPSGGTQVHVSAKITAWYADPVAAKSGYQVLPSNGRLESDFLDRLEELLGKTSVGRNPAPAVPAPKTENKAAVLPPAISAPQPQDTVPGQPIVSSKTAGSTSAPFKVGTITPEGEVASLATRKAVTDRHIEELTQEAKNLEEILRNQAHPSNLVAVRKSGAPVLVSPNEGAKVMFQATAGDEFEMLDENASWVHVRISGLSRGWLRRSSVEMPEDFGSTPEPQSAPAAQTAPEPPEKPFQVENEQIASFPGTWVPLRGKTVKIISVQEAKGRPNETGSQAKLEYAKSLFEREYVELTRSSTTAAGVVVVFDSEDGGMMATTLPVLQQWKAGTLSDEAMWRRCYFDPPDMFGSSTTP